MSVAILEAKAHELLGQLNHDKLAAVVHLLEVMVQDEDEEEELTEQERAKIQAGIDSLNKQGCVPMEDVLADFGLTMADFQKMSEGVSPERL